MNRKQRRAQEAKTRQGATLEGANRSAPMYDKVYAAEAKTASEFLAGKKVDREAVAHVIENAVNFAMAFNNEQMTYACGAGCYYCCYQKVGTTAVEIVHIAHWIREHMTPEQQAEILAKLDALVAERDPSGHVPVRCPFLSEEGTCRIYEVRPLSCRSVTSASSEPCRSWQEEGKPLGKVADYRRYTSHQATMHALDRALSSQGLQGGFLDFHAALRMALQDEKVVDAWYQGERPFSPATIPPKQRRLLPML